MWPLVKLTELLTRLLSGKKKKALIRRDEFIALSKIGIQEGAISETESRIMNNLFRFNQLTVADIMTPRTVIFALKQDMTAGDVLKHNPAMRFSRIPVYEKNVDDMIGFVLKSDILQQVALDKQDTKIKELLRTMPMLSRELSLQKLLDQLHEQKSHIAVVVDPYGGTAGVVTMEDYLETLLGLEIVDESDNIEDMQKLARQKWEERARDLGISTEI
jgi:CBS domain containing-hemolysin-like protein